MHICTPDVRADVQKLVPQYLERFAKGGFSYIPENVKQTLCDLCTVMKANILVLCLIIAWVFR